MSRVNFGVKPWLYPMPVLIVATYDENGVPDAMNAAWGIITDMNEISISMGEHKTTENIAKTGAFTVSMATADTVTASDYVGIESAAKVPDKFAKSGFHATRSEFVNAPLIDELPMALECKVKSFDLHICIFQKCFHLQISIIFPLQSRQQCLLHLNASILQHFLNTVDMILIHMRNEKIINLVHSSGFQEWHNPIISYI